MTTSRPPAGTATMDERLAGRQADTPLPRLRAVPPGRRRLPGPAAWQVAAAEAVLFGVAVLATRPPWLLVCGCVPAAAVLALLLARRRGHWCYEWLWLHVRQLRRGRALRARARDAGAGGLGDDVPGDDDPRRAALRELLPRLHTTDADERGMHLGVGHDGAGWFAAVEVTPGGATLPLRALAELVGDNLPRLQVVGWVVPAAVHRFNAWAPAAKSYVDVSARLAGGLPPARARTWVVARFDGHRAVTVAAARGGGTRGVYRALAAGLSRVGRVLSAEGIACRPLSADELSGALAVCLGVGPEPRPDAGRPRTEPRSDRLVVDGYPQVGYQIVDWPPYGERLRPVLDGAPAAWLCHALVLDADPRLPDDRVLLRGYLRVAALPGELPSTCRALDSAAELHGVTLRRPDGEQHAVAAATAPTGGPAVAGAAGHACPRAVLDRLAVPAAAGGVLLGRDPDHRPVLVPLFGDRPLRLVLLGPVWPARVVLLRCLASGAHVVASPGRPDWVSLGRWATGSDHWVQPPGADLVAHPAAPVLLGRDADGPAMATGVPTTGWRSSVVVADRPTAVLLAGADLVVTGRLADADADLVADTFGLGDSARLLGRMYDDMAAVVVPGNVRFVWPTPSPAEAEVLAGPDALGPAPGTDA